jgi:hypothetical protein
LKNRQKAVYVLSITASTIDIASQVFLLMQSFLKKPPINSHNQCINLTIPRSSALVCSGFMLLSYHSVSFNKSSLEEPENNSRENHQIIDGNKNSINKCSYYISYRYFIFLLYVIEKGFESFGANQKIFKNTFYAITIALISRPVYFLELKIFNDRYNSWYDFISNKITHQQKILLFFLIINTLANLLYSIWMSDQY